MSDDAVRTTTDLDADVDLVWEALTSPDGVASWLGDDSRLTPVEGSELDVADVETGIRKHGRVEEVAPGRRLTFVWWPEDDGPDAGHRVEVVLAPGEGPATRLTITETPTSAQASIAAHDLWTWRAAALELALLLPRSTCAGAVPRAC